MTSKAETRVSQGFTQQPLPAWRRAVLKIGSNLLTAGGHELSSQHARVLADFVLASRAQSREVVIVSSGAVAAGRARVHEDTSGLVARQALAALGQTRMVALWQELLGATPVAQVLLAHDDLRNRRRYLNARNTLIELLRLDAVPVINENDTVAVEELKLGDNDNLAAIVAALVDADLLLIASDVDGLYDAHPLLDPDAKPVESVAAVTADVLAMAGAAGSEHGTGGMHTKLQAATKAANAGIPTVLFNGTCAQTVALLGTGAFRGTRFAAASSRLAARKYWLRHAPGADGRIRVDAGAARALTTGKSLLPGGIVGADGEFQRGDIVEILCADAAIARGLVQYNAGEVRRLAGRQSREIEATLGFSYGDEVLHRNDLVILNEATTA
ncbi:MAG: glutamate 5-kinase [Rudaea sp.]|uniref:glutamate 5-kinase n=1 Tax=Rudaea sp. TaxID=2136325 RepID=UPI0039E6C55D